MMASINAEVSQQPGRKPDEHAISVTSTTT